ncbi:CNNM domain-containing protein [Geomicrobium halophilum]|uniref:CNNM domain-containing protein n=1 Tax=Geomicrobium halophilum TaxID=549000 RepID=UPI00160798ED
MGIAIVLCLLASAFFSGSETAMTAANRMKVQTKAENNDRKSEKLLKILSQPDTFITGILISNNTVNILLPTLVTMVAIEYGFNVGVATALLTVTLIVFAEVIPKSIAATFPDRITYIVFPVIGFVLWILKPLIYLLSKLTGTIIKTLSREEVQETSISKEELRTMVDIAHTEGAFANEETHRIKGVLDFYNLNVRDVLKTPRVEIVGIPYDASYEEARDIILGNRFTRYPVYREDMDNIIGMFHSKGLIYWSVDEDQQLVQISDMSPLYVHEFHSIEQVFRQMSKDRKHLAVILDEYGGTVGLLSHEDIIEAMIGQEIEDETDLGSEPLIESLSSTTVICNGKITLRRLNNVFGTEIPEKEDVLAAFILDELEHIPMEGDSFTYNHLEFTILTVEDATLKRVEIRKQPVEKEE